MLFQFLLVILLAYTSCDSFGKDYDSFESELKDFQGHRLPNNTKPISYDLHITTNIHRNDFHYKGSVIINIIALNDTDEIILHADDSLNNIKINLVDRETGTEFENVTYIRTRSLNDFFLIYSKPEPLKLKANKRYILTLSFNSTLEKDQGFYKSATFFCDTIDNAERNIIWMASTFFEPFFARFAFPCYDEPQLKARFKISITHGSNFTALSNMPADSEPIKIDEHMVTTTFKETPLMSTYAVAFLVAFTEKISEDIKNITSSVYSTRGCQFKGKQLLEIGAKTLNALGEYFGVDYPLPKLDHISIDGLLASGVENWGLITYDIAYLPLEPGNIRDDFNAANIIAHEIVHQWFGNLVTPKWWSNVWLNEGPASYYSHKVLDMLYPEMRAFDFQMLVQERNEWINFEERPMNFYVEKKLDIWQRFRKVFYWKGNQILRMFEHAIGEETFKKGMTKYLRRHQYSSVEENDLFESLQEAASEDMVPEFEKEGAVPKMMSSWTNQLHYPILKVETDAHTNSITITQYPITNIENNTDPRLWWIPITLATGSSPDFNNTKPSFIFQNERSMTFTPSDFGIQFDGENDWLILNKQCIGLYRVMYDESNYYKIIEALQKNKTVIHSYNKAQIIRDAAYLVEHKELPHLILYKLYKYLEDDPDIIAWNELLSDIYYYRRKLETSGGRYYFDYFFNKISKKVMDKVGTERQFNDTAFMAHFRHRLMKIRCDIDHSNCHVFDKYRSNCNSIATVTRKRPSIANYSFVKYRCS